MKVPWWVTELAATFWAEAGDLEPFPRSLRLPVVSAFSLAIIPRASLSTGVVRDWLRARHIAFPLEPGERPLRACLIVRAGGGVIFLDADDDAAEQRFSLAHELAHFLRHYWQPRRRASAYLGSRILEVFDGWRPAEPGERLRALLLGVPLGFHTHLMSRDGAGARPSRTVAAAEEEADRMAYELLAPATALAGRLGGAAAPDVRARVEAVLRGEFGLPPRQAVAYAELLFPVVPPDPLLVRLGLYSPGTKDGHTNPKR
jgi:hypothetical protein